MSETLNQYAVYRLRRDLKETRAFRYQSYQYLQEHHLKVISDYYEQVFLSRFDPALKHTDLRRRLEKELPAGITGQTLGVSDVLAITRGGISTAYYIDPDRMVVLTGFFHVASSGTDISIDTADYQIKGRPGLWFAADEVWIDGQNFFLMQSQKYGSKAAYAVLDSHGRQAAEDTTQGFTDEIIRQIREYIKSQDVVRLMPNFQNDNASPQNTISENTKTMEQILPAITITKQIPTKTEIMKPIVIETEYTITALERNIPNKDSSANSKSPPDVTQKKSCPQRCQKRKKELPLKRRKSVLKRLRVYQEKIAKERMQMD